MTPAKRYRFLFVSAPFGGIEVFCRNIKAVVESRDDIDAEWMWIEFEPPDRIARLPVIRSNWTLKGGLTAWERLRRTMAGGRGFDAAFFNHIIPLTFLRRFRRAVPTVLSLDITPELLRPYNRWYRGTEDDGRSWGSRLKDRMTAGIYRDARSLLPWSRLVQRSLVATYGVDEARTAVVPAGVDVQAWNRTVPYSGTSTDVNILFVGGDFLRKGGDLLLRTAAWEEFRHCRFHIVTKSFAGTAGPNVEVYRGMQANSPELRALYAKADLFVLPTRADLSPAVLCEAMAFGIPVVATGVGGLDEIVEEGRTGFIVPVDDEEAFAARVRSLAASPELRERMGRAARTRVEAHYDIRKNAGVIIDHMKRAAGANDAHQH